MMFEKFAEMFFRKKKIISSTNFAEINQGSRALNQASFYPREGAVTAGGRGDRAVGREHREANARRCAKQKGPDATGLCEFFVNSS